MYIKRQAMTTKLPIARKGTKYLARTASHLYSSVSVVVAVRDMLKLARNAKEVKEMIKDKLLKLNGKEVKDYRESIKLFNIFEADKPYILTILPTKKFNLKETKDNNKRLCKVIDKKLLSKNTIQLNFHDGSNALTKDKIMVQDSVYLDFSGKIVSHIPINQSKSAFVFKGKYSGRLGKIDSIENKKAKIKFDDKEDLVELPISQLIVQ